MGKTINALTEIPKFLNNDFLPIWHNGKTFKIAIANILSQLLESVDPLSVRTELMQHIGLLTIHHTHTNKVVLDQLSNNNGTLNFLGNPITDINKSTIDTMLSDKLDKIKTFIVGAPNDFSETSFDHNGQQIELKSKYGLTSTSLINIAPEGIDLIYQNYIKFNGIQLNVGIDKINMLSGATSNIQTQLNQKAVLASQGQDFTYNISANQISIGQGNAKNIGNTAIGTLSQAAMTTSGIGNTSLGFETMKLSITGSFNTAVGNRALTSVSGNENTAVGYQAGTGLLSGGNNTLIGSHCGSYLQSGRENTALGYYALGYSIIGVGNTGIGKYSLGTLITGSGNTAIGSDSLRDSNNVNNCTALGANTVISTLTSPSINNTTVIGSGASSLKSNQAVIGNSQLNELKIGGALTLQRTLTGNNLSIGYLCMENTTITSGINNIAVGIQSLKDPSLSGSDNIVIGSGSAGKNTTGLKNIVLGNASLPNNLTGSSNLTIGTETASNITTGSNNIFLGHKSGNGIITGSGNTILGSNVQGLAANLSNSIILANGIGGIAATFDGPNKKWVTPFIIDATGLSIINGGNSGETNLLQIGSGYGFNFTAYSFSGSIGDAIEIHAGANNRSQDMAFYVLGQSGSPQELSLEVGRNKRIHTKGQLNITGLQSFTSNALAIAGGLTIGDVYINGDNLCVAH